MEARTKRRELELSAPARYLHNGDAPMWTRLRMIAGVPPGAVRLAVWRNCATGDIKCRCRQTAMARHLGLHCEQREDKTIGGTDNYVEEKLLCRWVPLWPKRLARKDDEPEMVALRQALAEARARGQPTSGRGRSRSPRRSDDAHEIVVATDGGALNDRPAAAWGVAIGQTRIGAAIAGVDQTPGFAEALAVLQVTSAAEKQNIRFLHLLIDSQATIRSLNRVVDTEALPGTSPALWKEIRDHIRRGRMGICVEWVPSHNKRSGWHAEDPHDTKEWRRLNDAADKACTEAMMDKKLLLEPIAMTRKKAKEWTEKALKQLGTSLGDLRERYPNQRRRET